MSDSPLYISAGNTSGQSLKDFQLTTDVSSKSDFEYGKEWRKIFIQPFMAIKLIFGFAIIVLEKIDKLLMEK